MNRIDVPTGVRFAVGIDVGGTHLRAGLVDSNGRLWDVVRRPMQRRADASVIVADIIDAARTTHRRAEAQNRPVDGIGIALPHYSVGSKWVQTYCTNLPTLEGFELYPPLHEAFGNSIYAEFDTNAAALGELRFGAAAGFTRSICMIIGTGISCGIIVDGGTLLRYTFATAGETGHIIVDPSSSERCSAGCRGCLEAVTSGLAIQRAALEAIQTGEPTRLARHYAETGKVDAEAVAMAAEAGDALALQILDRAGSSLGIALASLMHIYWPDAIIIGGGVSKAGDLLLEPARRMIRAVAAPSFSDRLKVVRQAALGADAGIIGAAVQTFEATR
jgi:glucokinase